ncbi:nucleotide-binding protein, partial [Xanthomonas citri pv. citri]|nr:nucleotide-binding protein [Xanthomonas citri pv. citri]
ECTGTLGLLCEAIRKEQLTVPMVESLADDLIMGDYRLPFGPGGFKCWAEQQGLLG